MSNLIKKINSFTKNLHHDVITYEEVKKIFQEGNYQKIIHTINRIFYRGENGLINKLSGNLFDIYVELCRYDRYLISQKNIRFTKSENNIFYLLRDLIIYYTNNQCEYSHYLFFKIMKKMKILFSPEYLIFVINTSSEIGNKKILHKAINLLLFTLFFETRNNKIHQVDDETTIFSHLHFFERIFKNALKIAIDNQKKEIVYMLLTMIKYDGNPENVDFTISDIFLKSFLQIENMQNIDCTYKYVEGFFNMKGDINVIWLQVKTEETPEYAEFVKANYYFGVSYDPELLFFVDRSGRNVERSLHYYIRYLMNGYIDIIQKFDKEERDSYSPERY